MTDTTITFSAEILHGNSFSWSFGAVCSEECQDLKFIETSYPGFSEIHLSIRDTLSCLKDRFVFQIRSSVESCYAHCKSFFIESPFVKPVKKVVKALKEVMARGFRSAANAFLSTGCVPQANLGIFTL